MRDALKINVFAPLCSWGDFYPLKGYPTAVAPTKSAIVGLVGAWKGVERGDSKAVLDIQDSFSMITKIYRVGERSLVSVDYTTVLMPKKETEFQRSRRDIYADKANHRNPGVFKKEFLQNYAYEIILVDDGKIQLDDSPVFSPYFGRKSYAPCIPLHFERGDKESFVDENNIPIDNATLVEMHWEDDVVDKEVMRIDTRNDVIIDPYRRIFTTREEKVHVF